MQRDIVFDIMKGVGIILMMLGHLPVEGIAYNVIYSFHMPMFFIISGYFFSSNRGTLHDAISYLKKNVKSLLIPVLTTIILLLAVKGIRVLLLDTPFNFSHLIGPLWFLLAMFWARLILYVISPKRKFSWKDLLILFLSFVAICITHLCFSNPHIYIFTGVSATIYMLIGMKLRYYKISPFLIPLTFICWFMAIVYSHMDIRISSYGCLPLDIVGALGGTLFIYYFSKLIMKVSYLSKTLAYVGENSLLFLCMHAFEWYSGMYELMFSSFHLPIVIVFVIRFIITSLLVILIKRLKFLYPLWGIIEKK